MSSAQAVESMAVLVTSPARAARMFVFICLSPFVAPSSAPVWRACQPRSPPPTGIVTPVR
jgi:hypothetical protein